ncbi:hypothetical protein BJY52DRAFT_1191412 [Lactarius psammicola]|nr:hypothetical protein BJY52DRAFT_1191412 [Lactarius psammicola]
MPPSRCRYGAYLSKEKVADLSGPEGLHQVNGGLYDPSNPGIEANLDLQLAEAMTYPARNIFYSTGSVKDSPTDTIIQWVKYVLDQLVIPQTIRSGSSPSLPQLVYMSPSLGNNPEVPASISGGGFSDYFPRPDYQGNAVPLYFQSLGDEYQDFYYLLPDLRAGAQLPDRPKRAMGGTSAAAPVHRGIISPLNDFLVSKGKPPLGFINP